MLHPAAHTKNVPKIGTSNLLLYDICVLYIFHSISLGFHMKSIFSQIFFLLVLATSPSRLLTILARCSDPSFVNQSRCSTFGASVGGTMTMRWRNFAWLKALCFFPYFLFLFGRVEVVDRDTMVWYRYAQEM